MSLRIRLVLAFFLLSVVPLAAVTIYTYTTNVEALRVVAEGEADLLAGELGQRMQLVTARLSDRVENLMDIADLQAATGAGTAQPATAATTKPVSSSIASAAGAAPGPSTLSDQIARSLGETAMLLNNVHLQNTRRGGGGRSGGRGGQAPGAVPPPPPVTTVGRAIPTSAAPPATSPTPTPASPSATPSSVAGRAGEPPRSRGSRSGQAGGDRTPPQPRPGGGTRSGGTPTSSPSPSPGAPGELVPPRGPAAPVTPQASTITPVLDANGNLTIDMLPLRRDIIRQVLPPDKRYEDLLPEERQRLAAEVNQRMLGIQQGLQISAAELQKRAIEAERTAKATATAKAAAAPTAVTTRAAASDLKRRIALGQQHRREGRCRTAKSSVRSAPR